MAVSEGPKSSGHSRGWGRVRRTQELPSASGAHQASWDFTGEQPATWAHVEPDRGARSCHHTVRGSETLQLGGLQASGDEGAQWQKTGSFQREVRMVR